MLAAGVFGRRVVVKPFTAAGNSTRILRPPTPVVAAFSLTTNRPNVLLSPSAATTTTTNPNQFQQCTSSYFSSSSSTANHHPPPPTNNTTKTRKYANSSNTGVIAKFKHMIRTLFGTEDDTPRGKQERKEMYWIVLLVAHQRLRVANQQHQRDIAREQQWHPTNGNSYAATGEEGWEMESKAQLKQLMNEAVTYLDTRTDITQMSLKRLRNEAQSYLRPQIVHLLTVARYVDNLAINNMKEENNDSSSNDDEEDEEEEEDYIFNTNEEKMYKEILLYEYNHICQLLLLLHDSSITKDGGRTPNPRPFYIMKKDAIETLLKHYNWWSTTTTTTNNNNNENHSNNNDENDTEYIDPFGFVPNKATKDVVCAMRYYQTRNLIRSFVARRTQYYPPRDEKNKAVIRDTITQIIHQPPTSILLPPPPTRCYHTLLALKSTIPNNAGRGVYIDGFAPAGTLLAFIPGNVWTKEQLSNITTQTQSQLGHDPRHQLSMRYDDILIDSRHAPYTVINNLWSLGHIVNHPPPPPRASTETLSKNTNTIKSEKWNSNNIDDNDDDSKNEDNDNNKSQPTTTFHGPNCATVMINFTERMFDSDDNINNNDNNDNSSKKLLNTYLPNMYEYPPTTPYTKNIFETENVIMHGMGLIAIRDVMDEELFYDYRLCPSASSSDDNNNNGYPSWYHVWDEDALKKRWDTDDQ